MDTIDLSTEIAGLTLSDPFMIASSHWTSSENVFRQLALVRPSALTLKTTSHDRGGDGKEAVAKRDKRYLVDSSRSRFAVYTDGPPTLELWDIPTTLDMTVKAKMHLPDTILGLSVLQGEDYQAVRQRLHMDAYGYVELNWKYTFRGVYSPENIQFIVADMVKFLDSFRPLPRLVKLPREAVAFMQSKEFEQILAMIVAENAAMIVANSKKMRVPPSRVSGANPVELPDGVVVGEHLFLETYNLLKVLDKLRSDSIPVPTLIGSGGIVDIAGFVDVTAAGTDAVQLCTVLDLRRVQVLELLREQLRELCKSAGSGSFRNFIAGIRYSTPKWEKASQEARGLDLRSSDVVAGVLTDHSSMTILFSEALQMECSGLSRTVSKRPKAVIEKPYRFVIGFGNVSSFVLGQNVTQQLDFEALLIEDMSEFFRNLSQSAFQYDFAIIPRSHYSQIQKQPKRHIGSRMPVEVAHISSSHYEIVGNVSGGIDNIELVYHFGGVSSRNARNQLLGELRVEHWQELTEDIDLLPLLRFWNPGSAILAKPPLSRIYPLVAAKGLQKDWGSFWSNKDDLLLVASEATMSSSGAKEIVQLVVYELEEIREAIVRNPKPFAAMCINGGFLRYFQRLLTKDKSIVI